jgi:hypothetical protein
MAGIVQGGNAKRIPLLVMVGQAEQNAGSPEIVTTALALFVSDLLEALDVLR